MSQSVCPLEIGKQRYPIYNCLVGCSITNTYKEVTSHRRLYRLLECWTVLSFVSEWRTASSDNSRSSCRPQFCLLNSWPTRVRTGSMLFLTILCKSILRKLDLKDPCTVDLACISDTLIMFMSTWADSAWPPLFAPACPNWTSLLNNFAHVPETQATTGFLTLPDLRASTSEYSSTPPNSPRTTIILISGIFPYRRQWSLSVDPGKLSPPIAIPVQGQSIKAGPGHESNYTCSGTLKALSERALSR